MSFCSTDPNTHQSEYNYLRDATNAIHDIREAIRKELS